MKKFYILLPGLLLFLSGCIINIKTANGNDGGVFKSPDLGKTWTQITKVYRVSDIEKTFNDIDVSVLVMDPSDNQAIYLGTESFGMYYTYDGGSGWHQTLAGIGSVNAVAVDPSSKCIIYTAIKNKIYKSTDCSRHWSDQLIESRDDPNNQITALAVDSFNSNIVYAGTSGTGLFQSQDGGYSWHVVNYFNSRLVKILINPNDTRIIYVATETDGIYKTTDRGENWQQLLTDQVKDKRDNLLVYRDFILDSTQADGLMYASQYGLLRSSVGGNNWQSIKLLTPPGTKIIYSLAINPKNEQEIIYSTNNTLYFSQDGGLNWVTRALPTTRAARFIILDPKSPQTIYFGAKKVK